MRILLLCLTLGASGWIETKANGFTFQTPAPPVLKTELVTWPTTGAMTVTTWTSQLETGDKQLDIVWCYESSVETARLIGVLHESFCATPKPEALRFDRTDPTTQARECLRLGPGPDGKRRILNKILQVGPNVCVLTSSARFDPVTDEPSAGMRRFVDSLALTGKPTVLAPNEPWVKVTGPGFSFLLPQAAAPETADQSEPELGKYKLTRWKQKLGAEKLTVSCLEGKAVGTPIALDALWAQFGGQPGVKLAKSKLPNGATQGVISGSHHGLLRVFPLGGRVCVVSAMSETDAETTGDGRRFVEGFAKAR